jgi:hypothetical protein
LISTWRKLLELYVLNNLSKPTHRTLMAIMWVLGGSNLWPNINHVAILWHLESDHLWNKAITLWHIGLEHLTISNKQIKSSFQKITVTLASFRCKSQFLSMKSSMGVILSLGNLLLPMFCRLKKSVFDLTFLKFYGKFLHLRNNKKASVICTKDFFWKKWHKVVIFLRFQI